MKKFFRIRTKNVFFCPFRTPPFCDMQAS
jgi:hypothetical protein